MKYAYAIWLIATAITVLTVFCRNRKYPFGTPYRIWTNNWLHRIAVRSMVVTVLGSMLFAYLYFRQ